MNIFRPLLKGGSFRRRIRSTLHKGAVLAYRPIPLRGLARLADTPPLVVFYHVVSDEDLPHVKHLYRYKDAAGFESDIDSLLRVYTPLELNDLVRARGSNGELPRNSIFFTFDDGLRQAYDAAFPILRRKGIPAAFFVSTAFLDNNDLFFRFKASLLIEKELSARQSRGDTRVRTLFADHGIQYTDFASSVLRVTYQQRGLMDELATIFGLSYGEYLSANRPYMSSEQVRTLVSEGFSLGSHSIDHPLFRDLSLDEQMRQTSVSLSELKRRFGVTQNLFSFPFTAEGVTEAYYHSVRKLNMVDVFFGAGHFGVNVERPVFERMPFDEGTPHYLKNEYLVYLWRKYAGSLLQPAPD